MSGSQDEDPGQKPIDAVKADPTNDQAWTDFYLYFRRQVAAAILVQGGARRDVPDITQEVFRRFLEKSPWRDDWSKLPERPVVTSYLCTAARRLVIDGHRKRERSPDVDEKVDLDRLASREELSVSEGLDIKAVLRATRGRLKDDERHLLRLLVNGMPLSLIAENLGISYVAAGLRVHRLKRRLRILLSSES